MYSFDFIPMRSPKLLLMPRAQASYSPSDTFPSTVGVTSVGTVDSIADHPAVTSAPAIIRMAQGRARSPSGPRPARRAGPAWPGSRILLHMGLLRASTTLHELH